ncbi:hypothetical protein RhiJN_00415 [Ceratobasidium sp. AG-Ba]|nr:hypothetical protein RhiJN_00415 [Ceratobasidium sp. AG-Ba]
MAPEDRLEVRADPIKLLAETLQYFRTAKAANIATLTFVGWDLLLMFEDEVGLPSTL